VLRGSLSSSYRSNALAAVSVPGQGSVEDRHAEQTQVHVRDDTMAYRGHALMRISRIIFIQRWLSMRLDMCGNILLLAIGIYTAVRRYSVDPAKIGVILSYSITSA
jgi:hypothetical protein